MSVCRQELVSGSTNEMGSVCAVSPELRRSKNLAAAIICVLISFLSHQGFAQDSKASIWDADGIQDFSLTDRTGETLTRQNLLGKEWVAGFIFTRCKGPCPTVVGEMKILQERTGVTLVTFSVQPEVDTPDVLKNFATTYVPKPKPDANGKLPDWYWLTGDRETIYRLIIKSFKMPVAQVDAAEGYNVIHSNNLMHVDEKGRVLGKYNALEPAEMSLLRRIIEGKAPRGRMVAEATPQSVGSEVDVPGLKEAGLKMFRQPSEDSSAQETDGQPQQNSLPPGVPQWVAKLPALNASLNGLAAILLVTGYVCIKRKHARAHKVFMLSSFATSVVFLCSYLVYHWFRLTKYFPGSGLAKGIYYVILISHVILAAAVPVLASMTIYRAFRGQWERHLKIARITFPIWVYVSVTGVIIYFMLYHWPA